MSIAGGFLSYPEAQKVFKDTVGADMPQTFQIIGSVVRRGVKEMNTMFQFMETTGFGADIEECQKMNPELQDFATWLKESGKFQIEK